MTLHTETARLIRQMTELKPALRSAGIEIPVDFDEAIVLAKTTPDTQASHRVNAAAYRLANAANAEELGQAAAELAEAHAFRDATRSDDFVNALDAARARMLLSAIGTHSTEWFAALADGYNAEAPTFEEAAKNLPDIRETNPLKVSRAAADAAATARESAERLSLYFNAYWALGRIAADFEPLTGGSEWSDFREVVLLICEPQTWGHANEAAKALRAERWGAEVPLAPLFPHMVGVAYADGLSMATTPDIISERQERLLGEPGAGEHKLLNVDRLTGHTSPTIG